MGDETSYCILEWRSSDGAYHGKEHLKTQAALFSKLKQLLNDYNGDITVEIYEI